MRLANAAILLQMHFNDAENLDAENLTTYGYML